MHSVKFLPHLKEWEFPREIEFSRSKGLLWFTSVFNRVYNVFYLNPKANMKQGKMIIPSSLMRPGHIIFSLRTVGLFYGKNIVWWFKKERPHRLIDLNAGSLRVVLHDRD